MCIENVCAYLFSKQSVARLKAKKYIYIWNHRSPNKNSASQALLTRFKSFEPLYFNWNAVDFTIFSEFSSSWAC